MGPGRPGHEAAAEAAAGAAASCVADESNALDVITAGGPEMSPRQICRVRQAYVCVCACECVISHVTCMSLYR